MRRRPEAKHCSSLCSQSEGDEYCGDQTRTGNSTKTCSRALVMFATCSWPSLCEQSELQCFASDLRQMSARCPLLRCHIRYAICLKTAQRFFWILNTLPLTPSPPFLALSLLANLGADTTESGSRHDRIWEQTRSPLGAETPTSIGNEKARCCKLCPPIISRAALWPAMQGSALFIMAKPQSLG